jgi:beta-galactosidase
MTPEPGEMRRMALSSVARGADGLMFFRWRPAHFGAEIYWMGIIDHDDVPRRRYEEARQFSSDIQKIKGKLLGTSVQIDIGIAGADFDNQEAHKTYPIGLPSPVEDAVHLHRFAYQNGYATGFVHPEDDLLRLKVYYIPHWVMWDHAWTPKVRAFVEAGGTVIVGAMTGTRDCNNHIIREQAPGVLLAELTGVKVEEFGRIVAAGGHGLFQRSAPEAGMYVPAQVLPSSSAERSYKMQIGNRETIAEHLYETIEIAADVKVLGNWCDRTLAGKPMLTERKVGKGRAIYLATYLTPELVELLAAAVLPQAGVEPLVDDLPAGVEVSLRTADDRRLLFVINTTGDSRSLKALPAGTDLLTGKAAAGPADLAGYGCMVIELA